MSKQLNEDQELQIFDSASSTNDLAKDAAYEGAPHGQAYLAFEQSQGRGRRGHSWLSGRGGLYLSIVLRPELPMPYLVACPAVAALAIARVLREFGADKLKIKWPNDLVIKDVSEKGPSWSKLGGILTEAGYAAGSAFIVCGIGLNLNQPKSELSQDHLLDKAAGEPRPLNPICLAEILGKNFSEDEIVALAKTIRSSVSKAITAWADCLKSQSCTGPLQPILEDYFELMAATDTDVEVIAPNKSPKTMRLAGLDSWGKLVLIDEFGVEQSFSSEAISIRLI